MISDRNVTELGMLNRCPLHFAFNDFPYGMLPKPNTGMPIDGTIFFHDSCFAESLFVCS